MEIKSPRRRFFDRVRYMKLLLTSAAYVKNPEIGNEFLQLVGKKPSTIKIFLINTAKEKDKDWKWVKLTISELEKIGVFKENISVFSLDRKVKKEELKNIDVIYVCGGNTFVYLDKIRKTGLDKMIRDSVKRGKVYFGVSAGSCVPCPTIEMATWKHPGRNTIGLKNLKGLNLIPFLVTAHFEEKYRRIIEKAAKSTKYPIIALTDKQAILVKNKRVKIIGPGKKNIFNSLNRF